MPATKGSYARYEETIYKTLLKEGLNTAAACGVLANIQAESGFNPMNLQDTYETSLGYDNTSYTNAVNRGTYKNFSKDSAGYGLAQWTYSTRKAAMYKYIVESKKASIGSLSPQIEFLMRELQGKTPYSDYKDVWSMLLKIENSAEGAYLAGYTFCREFENPAGGVSTYRERGENARDTFWKYYSTSSDNTVSATKNKGKDIVTIARELKDKPTPYIAGGNLYNNNNNSGVDEAGFIYYCYTEAGVKIPQATTKQYREDFKTRRKVSLAHVSAGDLIFYTFSAEDSDIVAIATGSGTMIYADKSAGVVEVEMYTIEPDMIIRLVADSETSQDGSVGDSSDEDMYYVEVYDPYSEKIAHNLSKVESVGYDAGYLIDMTYGDMFKFYIPEFTEQAGAQWEPINLRGRSVEVRSYNSTSSRNITISLDLYAGVGMYEAIPGSGETGEDTVGRLHRDANFVKSLEYPDYSTAITRPPATVHLILGSVINIAGVVSGVSVQHLKPVDAQNRSMYIKLSFTVTQTAVNPPDWKDIREGRYHISSTANIDSINTSDASSNVLIYAKEGE